MLRHGKKQQQQIVQLTIAKPCCRSLPPLLVDGVVPDIGIRGGSHAVKVYRVLSSLVARTC